MPRPQQPSSLARMFLGNWRNKGTSMVFAVLIWFFAFNNTKQEETFPILVQIKSSDPNQIVLQTALPGSKAPFDSSVEVTLKGPRNLLKAVSLLSPPLEGFFSVDSSQTIKLQNGSGYPLLPGGVTVEGTVPTEVVVELDLLAKRSIPIEQGFVGSPSPRFRAPTRADMTFEPATVEVRGPASLLDSVRVSIVQTTIAGWDEPVWEGSLPLVLTRSQGGPVQHREIYITEKSSREVRVRIDLKSALEEDQFQIPIRLSFASDTNRPALRITNADEQVTLTCRGTRESLAELHQLVKDGAISIWIEVTETGTAKEVHSSKFQWAEGQIPAGIERSSMTFRPDIVIYKVVLESEDEGTDE